MLRCYSLNILFCNTFLKKLLKCYIYIIYLFKNYIFLVIKSTRLSNLLYFIDILVRCHIFNHGGRNSRILEDIIIMF